MLIGVIIRIAIHLLRGGQGQSSGRGGRVAERRAERRARRGR
jgi:hypothetical protein